MRSLARLSTMALLVIGAALPLQAYIGFVVGNPGAPPLEVGACVGGEALEPTTGNLYMSHENAPNDILAIMDGGTTLFGCNGWSMGFFDCPGANFRPEPSTAAEAVWVVVPIYPAGEAATSHRGWVFVDVTPGDVADFTNSATVISVPQALWPLGAAPGAAFGGTAGSDPTTGVDFRFRAVAELRRSFTVAPLTCEVGGDPSTDLFDDRPLAGYNVYRLANIAAATSTPQHYLCGPDLNCSAALDNGWIAFIPSGTGAGGGGLDLGNPDDAANVNDNNLTDAFGVRDVTGDPRAGTAEAYAVLIYSDNPSIATRPPANLTDSFTYVFQPVLKGNANEDADSDTIPDLDLDNDGTPEFISPQGQNMGLGLTADLGGQRTILVSGDMACNGATSTPAGDTLQFQGVYNQRSQSFDLNFISAVETNVAGYNVFRSTQANDPSSYAKVNTSLIPAKGAPLSSYAYSDSFRAQARRGTVTYYYKIEAVRMDGSTRLYGPYQVVYTGAGDARRDRSLR